MNIQKTLKEFMSKMHKLNEEMKLKRLEVSGTDDSKLIVDGNAKPISFFLDSKLLAGNNSSDPSLDIKTKIKNSLFQVLENAKKQLEKNSDKDLLPKNLENIFKSNNRMNNMTKALENKMKSKIFTGISSGSYVKFSMNGDNVPLTLEINDSVLDDKELLEDLITSALKNAYIEQENDSKNIMNPF